MDSVIIPTNNSKMDQVVIPISHSPVTINPSDKENNEDKKVRCCINITAIICILIITLPFAIADLIFGYSDQPCVNLTFSGIDMNIGTWLRVSGYIQIASIVLMIIFQFINEECSKIMGKLMQYLFGMFFVAWTIVGAVIFWKYLQPNDYCNGAIVSYLWARLIIGLVNSGCFMMIKNK